MSANFASNESNDDLIIFGRTSSKSRIHSSCEFAFETLRKDLSRHMEMIAETTKKLDYTESIISDSKLANKMKQLHRIYRNQVASIPTLWETNEETLRWLINPNEITITVGISQQPSLPIDFGHWNDILGAFSFPNTRHNNNNSKEYNNTQQPPQNAPNNYTDSSSSSSLLPPSYDALNQVLIHLSRDWGDRGQGIRKALYTDGVIKQLERFLPVASSSSSSSTSSSKSPSSSSTSSSSSSTAGPPSYNSSSSSSSSTSSSSSKQQSQSSPPQLLPPRVLVPGAGLGRLAVELAMRGYAVEANECSAAMVCSMASIVNKLLKKNKKSSDGSFCKDNDCNSFNHHHHHPVDISDNTSDESDSILNNAAVNNTSQKMLTFYPHLYGSLMDLWSMEQRLAPETILSTDSAALMHWFEVHAVDAKNGGHNYNSIDADENKQFNRDALYSKDGDNTSTTAAATTNAGTNATATTTPTTSTNTPTTTITTNATTTTTTSKEFNTTTTTTTTTTSTSNIDIRQFLSIQFSEFVSTYSRNEYHQYFDGIVTCFFIDTAESILDYFLIIRHILKPHGVWVNAGPLHYHRPSAFFYSYSEIKQLLTVVLDFELLYESDIHTLYVPEDDVNMKPEMYHIPLFVMRNSDDDDGEEKDVLSDSLSDSDDINICNRSSNNSSYACQNNGSDDVDDDDDDTEVATYTNLNQPNFILKR